MSYRYELKTSHIISHHTCRIILITVVFVNNFIKAFSQQNGPGMEQASNKDRCLAGELTSKSLLANAKFSSKKSRDMESPCHLWHES